MTEIDLLTAQIVGCTRSMLRVSGQLELFAQWNLEDNEFAKKLKALALDLTTARQERVDEASDAVAIIDRASMVEGLEAQILKLENQVSDLRSKAGAYDAMKMRADGHSTLISELQKQLTDRDTRITDLEDILECANGEISFLDADLRYRDTNEAVAEWSTKAIDLQDDLLNAENVEVGLRAENAGLKNRVAELTRELETAHVMTAGEREARLQRECNEWSKENAALREELGRREDAYDLGIAQSTKQRDEHAKRADTFEEAFRILRSDLRVSLHIAEKVEVWHGR